MSVGVRFFISLTAVTSTKEKKAMQRMHNKLLETYVCLAFGMDTGNCSFWS